MEIKKQLSPMGNYDPAIRDTGNIQYLVIHLLPESAFGQTRVTGTSVHYLVHENAVLQAVPDECAAWHCGTKGIYAHPFCRNTNSLGLALCGVRDAAGQYAFSPLSLHTAAVLAAQLCHTYGIRHILRHYDVTHAPCPEPFVRSRTAWQTFLAAIQQNKKA